MLTPETRYALQHALYDLEAAAAAIRAVLDPGPNPHLAAEYKARIQDHQGERTSTGGLLAGVTNTGADPARVRESMTDDAANGLLWDSICRTGTPSNEAQAIADLFAPITDGTGTHADLAARRAPGPRPSAHTTPAQTEAEGLAELKRQEREGPITLPDPSFVGLVPRFSLQALAEQAATRWRTDRVRAGLPLDETWEQTVAREKASLITADTPARVPTPKELAEQRARDERA